MKYILPSDKLQVAQRNNLLVATLNSSVHSLSGEMAWTGRVGSRDVASGFYSVYTHVHIL
jgi:hypothetical protein